MKKNNYNYNKNGISVEFVGFYDTNLSYMEFNDNFINFKEYYFYTDFGNIEQEIEILIERIKTSINNNTNWNIEDYEIIDKILAREKCTVITTKGYCQGDSAEVIIPTKLLEKCWGGKFNIENMQEEIDHLFWDAPVYARLEIEEEEIYLDEYLQDRYFWDKDYVIEQLTKKYSQEVMQEIENILPEYLDYN